MEHFRIYLAPELSKLRDASWAAELIRAGGCDGVLARLSRSAESIAEALASRELVVAYVKTLSDGELVELARCLSLWRRNPVGAALLRSQRAELLTVDLGKILLNEAETDLHGAWRRLGGRLTQIAKDPEVLAHPEYAGRRVGDRVVYPICLARPEANNPEFLRVVDGVHRAIQMARNGAESLTLCVLRST